MTDTISIEHYPETAAYRAALDCYARAETAMHDVNEYSFDLCQQRLDNANELVRLTRWELREAVTEDYGGVTAQVLVDRETRRHEGKPDMGVDMKAYVARYDFMKAEEARQKERRG